MMAVACVASAATQRRAHENRRANKFKSTPPPSPCCREKTSWTIAQSHDMGQTQKVPSKARARMWASYQLSKEQTRVTALSKNYHGAFADGMDVPVDIFEYSGPLSPQINAQILCLVLSSSYGYDYIRRSRVSSHFSVVSVGRRKSHHDDCALCAGRREQKRID